MKKVHIALGIPAEYCEWCWLLSPLHREKGGLPSKEEIKRIKDEALARPIAAVEPAANDGGKKRSSSPACKPLAENNPRTSSAARGSSSIIEKPIIDLTSPNRAKKTVEHVKPAALKHPSRAKSGSASVRLTAMKSRMVDSAAKVALGPIPPSAKTNSSAEKGKSTCIGTCERSTESEAEEFPDVCALLKADLLEDLDACTKFVDNVGKVIVCLNSFAKRPAYSRRSSPIATMHKTLILVSESMCVD
ncbi:hypothetical protein ACFX15_027087 [Malus domestica]